MRKGMGKGTGKGYKNMIGVDSRVHSQSSKGIKQPQKINVLHKNYSHLSMAQKKALTKNLNLKDTDKDGVADKMDCRPYNKNRQDEEVVEVDKILANIDEETDQKTFKNRLKSFGKKVSEGVSKGVELTKERIAEQKAKTEARRLELKKDELTELKRPEVKKLEAQEKRVDELRFQLEAETDEDEKDGIKEELDNEEYQLNERIEEVTDINVEDYSDAELRKLAIRYKPSESFFADMFGSGENPYKEELVRRVKANKSLERELAKARKEKPEDEEKGLFDDIFN